MVLADGWHQNYKRAHVLWPDLWIFWFVRCGARHQRFYRSSQVVLPGVRSAALVDLDSTFQVGHFFQRKVVVCAQLCLPSPPAFSLSFLCTPVPPQHKGTLREMPPTTACRTGPRLLRISSFCSGVLRVLVWRAVWWCR